MPRERRDPTRSYVHSTEMCPGSVNLAGYRDIMPVSAQWNLGGDAAGVVEVADGAVLAHMKGRAYFGDACAGGWAYNNVDYAALQLLGKRFRYTVDVSGTECGCNAALYLTSMKQNFAKSDCLDHYCDAANVCGVTCAEIDIQEANKHAWHSTLHTASDPEGIAQGYGAYHQEWNASVYGPGARCIDTTQPFDVGVSFPIGADGQLLAMEVELTQTGKPCSLPVRLDRYKPSGATDGMAELTSALQAGMTPIISYWGISANLEWLDGRGDLGRGPCDQEISEQCADIVRFSAFAIEPLSPVPGQEPLQVPQTSASPTASRSAPVETTAAAPEPATRPSQEPRKPQPGAASVSIAPLEVLPRAEGSTPAPLSPAGQPAPWEVVRPIVVAAPMDTPAREAGLPSMDRIVIPWVTMVIGGLAIFGVMHYLQIGGAQGLKTYEKLEAEAQVGDEVLVRAPFICAGRWLGNAHLEEGTRGMILEAGAGETIVRFDRHSGQFRVTEDQLQCLEWRPRHRTLRTVTPTSRSSSPRALA